AYADTGVLPHGGSDTLARARRGLPLLLTCPRDRGTIGSPGASWAAFTPRHFGVGVPRGRGSHRPGGSCSARLRSPLRPREDVDWSTRSGHRAPPSFSHPRRLP